MPEFFWKAARLGSGIVEGRILAQSQVQATLQLRAQGLTPIQIGPVGATPGVAKAKSMRDGHAKPTWSSAMFSSKKITQDDMLAFTSELSIMLRAGLPLDNALRVLIEMSAKPVLAGLTQSILDDVKGGVPLSKVLSGHPQYFGDFYINMIRSGEVSGQLSGVLERLIDHLERLRALRESVVSATIYPAILLGVALLSLVAMLGFVVPQFETLFKSMGDALPIPTRIVMELGHVFTDYGIVIGAAAVVFFLTFRAILRSPAGQKWWQARVLTFPVAGTLLLKYDLTLYSRSLGTLLGNGVPLLQSMQIASQTVGNVNLRFALEAAIPKVKNGGKMVDALRASGIFEPLALSLVRVGEETGRMAPMLLELARIFNRDVEAGIKRGLALLEPVLILVLGVIVASIIVSILLGILSENDLAV